VSGGSKVNKVEIGARVKAKRQELECKTQDKGSYEA